MSDGVPVSSRLRADLIIDQSHRRVRLRCLLPQLLMRSQGIAAVYENGLQLGNSWSVCLWLSVRGGAMLLADGTECWLSAVDST